MLERLSDAFLAETEVLADDHAARAATTSDTGPVGSLVLASALVSLAAAYRPHAAAEPGIGIHAAGAPGLLARRVRRLAGEAVPVRLGIAPSGVLSAFVALAVVWLSILPVLHAAPEAAPGTLSVRCGYHR